MSDLDMEQIYRQYFEPVYRYAFYLSRDTSRAEEIAQETFFKALQSLDRYRGESSIRTWLFAIARNQFLSEQRRQKREQSQIQESAEKTQEEPEEQILASLDSSVLHHRLHDLPEPYREVFSLRVFAELGFREIGELFGKTENWACVVYHRAKAKLCRGEEKV